MQRCSDRGPLQATTGTLVPADRTTTKSEGVVCAVVLYFSSVVVFNTHMNKLSYLVDNFFAIVVLYTNARVIV